MRILLALISLMMVSNAAQAAPERYSFDKIHTQVLFFVDHIGFSKSQGEFHDYDGFIEFDQENPAQSKVEVTFQTESIDMDDEKWNDHMKNSDFFNVTEYPTMTFKSTKINITGEKTADIVGDLTILDVTKPAILKTTFNKAAVHPFSKEYVAGFSATAKVKRSDFGIKYGLPLVGDDVDIRLEVEALRAAE